MRCVNTFNIPLELRKPIYDTGSDTLSRSKNALRKRFFEFYRYIISIGNSIQPTQYTCLAESRLRWFVSRIQPHGVGWSE